MFRKLFQHRFGPLAVLALVICGTSFLTRIALLIYSWPNLELNPLSFIAIFLIGLFYDLVVFCYFAIPVALYCWLMKDSWYQRKWQRVPLFILFFILFFIIVFNVGGEIIFWDEFGVRYNFIAVDYLIYTTEVIQNIVESYNLPLILGAVVLATAIVLFFTRKPLTASQQVSMRFKHRTLFFLVFMVFPTTFYLLVNNRIKNFTNNNYVNELSGNGIYEFGFSYWNNEIDYTRFYAVRNDTANFMILRKMLASPNATFTKGPLSVEREIKSDSPEHKWNVVLISVESLSGDYLKHFGDKRNITPFLDSLIPHSLFFDSCYASGTRTVRGLEALSLGIPPTPGQSIVRRPNNEDMFTIGNVFKSKGYDVNFVYGGKSRLDNMAYFFNRNGYKVLDKEDIPESMWHHTTAWGIDDEASFNYALEQCDKNFAANKLFFSHIMTVSNHRPYTYPDGRIDIPPSTQSIEGAVKYTDFAINKFLLDAGKKPWFNNTLFVIIADHCSKSAGKTDLPVNRYHIPCWIYGPALIKTGIEKRMFSQIDLDPTILGLMNMSYTSRFLGNDIFRTDPSNERIFISTYQDMGYLKDGKLVVLSPRQKVKMYKPDMRTGVNSPIPLEDSLVKQAIAWYQGASFLFKNGGYKK